MITSSDREYQATKRIKQGLDQLVAPFDDLTTWISERWGVTVLNVIYDRRNELHPPRIQVILEHQKDVQSFRDGYNFDPTKEQAIASKFNELVNLPADQRYDVDGLFVVFFAFAPIAIADAVNKISEQEIGDLKRRIGNPDLWEISRSFGHVTFMFYTDAQAINYAALRMKEEYALKYFEILKRHIEFDYLTEENFSIDFDSKQNFDDHFRGSWHCYYN